jgi:hypothetical protein
MNSIISNGFRVIYPGIARVLKSKIKIGKPCLETEQITCFDHDFMAI